MGGGGESRHRRDQDHGAGGGAQGGGQQPQVPRGVGGEGQPEGAVLQGADQDADRQAEAGRGQGGVCGEVGAEAAARGGQAGRRARQGDGEVQDHHRGARAHLRRDVRLLIPSLPNTCNIIYILISTVPVVVIKKPLLQNVSTV